MTTDIANQVKEIIAEILEVPIGEVVGEASLTDDLGADSLETIEMVMAFEDKFGLDIPDEEADKIRTVAEAVAFVLEKAGPSRVGVS